MKVLLICADSAWCGVLAAALCRRGHYVECADLRVRIREPGPAWDCTVLDLDLEAAGLHAYEICRQIKRSSAVPVLALAGSPDEVDRAIGPWLAADDCVVKPYALSEVVARIEAVARRYHVTAPAARLVRAGAAVIDVRARRVTLDEVEIPLTRKEFDLLAFLAENAGAVCPRDQIIKQVWDENWSGSTRTVDVHVGSLRRKLGRACPIDTVHGVGFRLSAT